MYVGEPREPKPTPMELRQNNWELIIRDAQELKDDGVTTYDEILNELPWILNDCYPTSDELRRYANAVETVMEMYCYENEE